jgi:hypothetical protein
METLEEGKLIVGQGPRKSSSTSRSLVAHLNITTSTPIRVHDVQKQLRNPHGRLVSYP